MAELAEGYWHQTWYEIISLKNTISIENIKKIIFIEFLD
jgi:hypothetical protein